MLALIVAAACGGGDTPADADPTGLDTDAAEEGAPDDTAEGVEPGALEFSIVGRDERMGAQAILRVREGDPIIRLSITGADSGSDLIVLDLSFDSIASSLGAHSVEFSLPYQGDHMANASLDGEPYHSQGGDIDLVVTADRRIEGNFRLTMAHELVDQTPISGAPGQVPDFAPTEDVTDLAGAFAGYWTLSCQSRLAGHDAFTMGGQFCEDLEL